MKTWKAAIAALLVAQLVPGVAADDNGSSWAKVSQEALYNVVCQGEYEITKTSTQSTYEKRFLYFVYVEQRVKIHNEVHITFSYQCEAGYAFTVEGGGGAMRQVTFDKTPTGRGSELIDFRDETGLGDQDSAKRCSYAVGSCWFRNVEAAEVILQRSENRADSVPATTEVCLVPPNIVALNRAQHAPIDLILEPAKGTGGGEKMCKTVQIHWNGNVHDLRMENPGEMLGNELHVFGENTD